MPKSTPTQSTVGTSAEDVQRFDRGAPPAESGKAYSLARLTLCSGARFGRNLAIPTRALDRVLGIEDLPAWGAALNGQLLQPDPGHTRGKRAVRPGALPDAARRVAWERLWARL